MHGADPGSSPSLPVYKIIYHSQIAVNGGQSTIVEHVKQILSWSRNWNPRHGITGALMLNEDNFSQVLEGPPHAVKALFGHIACDPRHKNVELLQCDYFKERDFTNWSMAFAGSATEPDITLAKAAPVDASLHPDAHSVVALLRWLLREKRITVAIRGGLAEE